LGESVPEVGVLRAGLELDEYQVAGGGEAQQVDGPRGERGLATDTELVTVEQVAVEPEVVGGDELRVHLHDLLQVVFARCGRLDEIEVLACAFHQKTTGHGCSFRGVAEATGLL